MIHLNEIKELKKFKDVILKNVLYNNIHKDIIKNNKPILNVSEKDDINLKFIVDKKDKSYSCFITYNELINYFNSLKR